MNKTVIKFDVETPTVAQKQRKKPERLIFISPKPQRSESKNIDSVSTKEPTSGKVSEDF